MWFNALTEEELIETEAFGERLMRAVAEIRELRKEVAAFEAVRRYINPKLVKDRSESGPERS